MAPLPAGRDRSFDAAPKNLAGQEGHRHGARQRGRRAARPVRRNVPPYSETLHGVVDVSVHDDVEPTNNHCERALRHAVLWPKSSFGTQSALGSRFVETMLSIIETTRRQNRNVFDFVATAVENYFENAAAPKLLPGA
ncbi:MAG: hypothetical protein D6725_09080 [Planctomycetota bacterium]|nr:MAG: hypothetical protein D6725_09080 [Planctomycetota bacterium]